jgi:hypothetical protein
MRISELSLAIGAIEIRRISTLQRQSGKSVEPAASTRSNFDMTVCSCWETACRRAALASDIL